MGGGLRKGIAGAVAVEWLGWWRHVWKRCQFGGVANGGVGYWYAYLIAQHACLEALPILPTL